MESLEVETANVSMMTMEKGKVSVMKVEKGKVSMMKVESHVLRRNCRRRRHRICNSRTRNRNAGHRGR